MNTRFTKAAEADTGQYMPPSCTKPMTHGREARPKCDDQELDKGSPRNLLRIAVTSSAPLFIWLSLMPCLTTAGTGTPGLQKWGKILKSHQRIDCLEALVEHWRQDALPAGERCHIVPEKCRANGDEQCVGQYRK